MVPSVREFSIQHKDLLPVVYVTGDMAGDTDSPLYGLFGIAGQLEAQGGPEQLGCPAAQSYDYAVSSGMANGRFTTTPSGDMGIATGRHADLSAGGGAVPFVSGAAGHHGAPSL